ncbi:MAG TPA: hypothetical protein DCQ98_04820 [Planctomycetaceae bacterium]|nr:hypothetical protein [Planctomycetaceae bacterium]
MNSGEQLRGAASLPVSTGESFGERVARTLGIEVGRRLDPAETAALRRQQRERIRLLLAAGGFPAPADPEDDPIRGEAIALLQRMARRRRSATSVRSPVDARIEAYLADTYGDLADPDSFRLPERTLILDHPGVARELSLPFDRDEYRNDLVESYRVLNGVLHNPKHDRRTTVGTFHVAEGGLPISDDKRTVPRLTFVRLLQRALAGDPQLDTLPYTSTTADPVRGFVSLLVRPIVSPEIPGFSAERTMEIRFFAPGGLVSNLDFVESIFGNGANPFDPAADAGLDVEHWSGHTGCVILAPHLIRLTKRELGLPHVDQATERKKADRMCWSDPDEKYNDGQAFKVTSRDASGVVVTLIADNYFGYCKKEVKTQLSYAANLMGNVEEEHAGGAIAFQSYSLGDEFAFDSRRYNDRTFDDVVRDYGDQLEVDAQLGCARHRRWAQLRLVPENDVVSIKEQSVRWKHHGEEVSIPLLPGEIYMGPSGYRVRLERHPAAPSWRLIGTMGAGTFCHKPCTVSGGGKSEIGKSLKDFMLYGPIFVADLESDLEQVEAIFRRDYSDRWRADLPNRPSYAAIPSRGVLDPERSLGSVIKLLTPSDDYAPAYNAWLSSIPNHIYAIVFIIKRFQRPGWDQEWRRHFYVDVVNGHPGHELKFDGRTLVGQYLRVGLLRDQAWRTFKLRQDFAPSEKLQLEDDITASVVLPGEELRALGLDPALSHKFVVNCEYRLFQRPDEAIHRGMDKQAEADMAEPNNFLSNFQPLQGDAVEKMIDHAVDLDRFTPPMQELLRSMRGSRARYVVSSSDPRVIDGRVSKNPRYLQTRPDLVRPAEFGVAEMGIRLFRALPPDVPVTMPVDAVLFGRRNNPPEPEAGIKGLCVYNPIHYQPLPELMIEFAASLSGKSPSTTGFGSEGAMTKGPFNSLPLTIDLNAALVSYALTGLSGFSTSAGHIGPEFRVDHDISLLVPEIWSRIRPEERDPQRLIDEGLLERLEDYTFQGRTILQGRLGYRITREFVRRFLGRIFDNPGKVFDDRLLEPELQDPEAYAEGIDYLTDAQRTIAQAYFRDGTIELACPPLRRLLELVAEGAPSAAFDEPGFREAFTREAILDSEWYRRRIEAAADIEASLARRKVEYVRRTLEAQRSSGEAVGVDLEGRLAAATELLRRAESAEMRQRLRGRIGTTPLKD